MLLFSMGARKSNVVFIPLKALLVFEISGTVCLSEGEDDVSIGTETDLSACFLAIVFVKSCNADRVTIGFVICLLRVVIELFDADDDCEDVFGCFLMMGVAVNLLILVMPSVVGFARDLRLQLTGAGVQSRLTSESVGRARFR